MFIVIFIVLLMIFQDKIKVNPILYILLILSKFLFLELLPLHLSPLQIWE